MGRDIGGTGWECKEKRGLMGPHNEPLKPKPA